MNCNYCNKPAQWVDNKVIYGRRFGKSYMAWWCEPCGAYVGCKNNTKEPLGTLANAELRDWRKVVHSVIDTIWKSGAMTRGQLYSRMRVHFGYEVHVGESNIMQCEKIIAFGTMLAKELGLHVTEMKKSMRFEEVQNNFNQLRASLLNGKIKPNDYTTMYLNDVSYLLTYYKRLMHQYNRLKKTTKQPEVVNG